MSLARLLAAEPSSLARLPAVESSSRLCVCLDVCVYCLLLLFVIQIKTRVEVLDVGGALIEIDYVSQENKDIQKRRLHLFRVEANNIEYFLQAPSNNQRNNWLDGKGMWVWFGYEWWVECS